MKYIILSQLKSVLLVGKATNFMNNGERSQMEIQ